MRVRPPRPAGAFAFSLALLLSALAGAANAAGTMPALPGGMDPNELPAGTANPLEELQKPESKPIAEISSPVDAATYIVGPGDVMEVHVEGALSQTLTMVVGPEGTVFMRGYGTVRVGGLTLEKARDAIRQQIGGGSRRELQLDIQLTRVRMLRVYPTGMVTSAAPVELPATARISDALEANRLIAVNGSHRNVRVQHRDGTVETADLGRFVRIGDSSLNPLVRDDDVLQVGTERAFVEVTGAVARPARIEMGPADSLRTLLALGGGALDSARPDSAMFVRWTSPTTRESSWVSLDAIASGAVNPPLRDGDALFVYFLPEYHRLEVATILGEVKVPGVYPLHPGVTRLSDLIRLAGGFGDRADQRSLHVFRARPGSVRPDTRPDPEFERLATMARSQMTNSEYDALRTQLSLLREDYRVDWTTVQKNPENDILLLRDDLVRVDPLNLSVRVDGQVRQPGLVQYRPGQPIYKYIDNAGGFTDRASSGKILVTRTVNGQTIHVTQVNDINPGDMIYVPERSDRTIWDQLAVLIAVGAQVATIVIAVRHY
ncbi:MAG TPA: SLBB domain-containing protein [Candidatus Sulfotelmatobacter sp.]|nr:SLBB domain-containing protein [Candidatus Sulfotelmatobacter sp.]